MTCWDAADYACHSRGQFGWAMSVIERLGLQGREDVVDVGCGDGKVTAEIAARTAGHVLGIDQSPDMIGLAERWSARHTNLAFLVADAQSLRVPTTFDVAFSNAAIHWMRDHRAVVEGLARILRTGGRIFLSMGGRGTAALVLAALTELSSDSRWARSLAGARAPYNFRSVEDFESPLRDAGFEVTRIALIAKPMRHADRAALTGWLRTTWMWVTNRIPEMERAAFLEVLTDRVAPGCQSADDGALLMPMVNLEIEAFKPRGENHPERPARAYSK
jgi:trans-aconitate methyltransferase